ncbi:MAG: hypothetical protein R3E83_04900 [Burkholderiaceae bacterium]
MISGFRYARASIARGLRHALVASLAVAMLGACSPTFDWRELRPSEIPVVILLPARPSQMQREILLGEHKLPMQMIGARAGEQIFTAAWVDLRARMADAAAPGHEAVLDAMVRGMLRNIGADKPRERPVALTAVSQHDGSRLTIKARRVDAEGMVDGRSVAMRAVFASLPTQAHQFVIIGERIDDEAAQMFFDAIRLTALPDKGA